MRNFSVLVHFVPVVVVVAVDKLEIFNPIANPTDLSLELDLKNVPSAKP